MNSVDSLKIFEGYYDDEDDILYFANVDIESNEIFINGNDNDNDDNDETWNVKLVIEHGPPYFYAKGSFQNPQNELVLHLHWKVEKPDAAISAAINYEVFDNIYAEKGEHAAIVNLD
jgi:hypothetical protein